MTNTHPRIAIRPGEIRNLRYILILLTLLQIAYFALMFVEDVLFFKLQMEYKSDWILALLNYSVAGLFIWYNWKRLPIEKKKKKDATWMILFLGIIGMWLWLPNAEEIKRINGGLKKNTEGPNHEG